MSGLVAVNKINTDLPRGTLIIMKQGDYDACERYFLDIYPTPFVLLKINGNCILDINNNIVTNNIKAVDMLIWREFEIINNQLVLK